MSEEHLEFEVFLQEMADARQALAEEVATKHDQLMLLKTNLQMMEDKCLQSDKQIAFKEDIIKELRKEVKQLKQQVSGLTITIRKLPNNWQVSIPEKPLSSTPEKPYIIVNHSSTKQPGRNTVIYINKDGSVRKEESFKKDHLEICTKCKSKLTLPNCKSENDLVGMKNALKPVTERSKLTNLSRRRTFVFDRECSADLEFVPVKTHIDYLEKRTL